MTHSTTHGPPHKPIRGRDVAALVLIYLASVAGLLMLAAGCGGCGGCGSPRVVFSGATTPVRLAEPISARVYVHAPEGWIKGANKVTIPEGWYCVPPPPATRPAK